MVLKNHKLMVNDFIKQVNKTLDFTKEQEIKITWYDVGMNCFMFDLEHNGIKFEENKDYKFVIAYVYGYSNAISDSLMHTIADIWTCIVRFDDITENRL